MSAVHPYQLYVERQINRVDQFLLDREKRQLFFDMANKLFTTTDHSLGSAIEYMADRYENGEIKF